jgi:hypothetical protein
MKVNFTIACAAVLVFSSCKKELLTNQELTGAPGKHGIAQVSAESDAFFSGFTPDPAYQMVFTDRFFNNNIGQGNDWWTARTNNVTYNGFEGYNRSINNSVANGIFSIAFNKDSDGKYYGGGIISKKYFGYGYYEAKIKVYNGSYGLHQSFWSYANAVEIDGAEFDSKYNGRLSRLEPNRHRWKPYHEYYRKTSADTAAFVDVPNSDWTKPVANDDGIWTDTDGIWYTIGYEWLPGEVKYYVNGVLKNTFGVFDTQGNDLNVFQPAQVYLTALPFKNSTVINMETPQPGAKMQVEYFAYYNKRLNNVNLLGNSGFEYVNNASAVSEGGATAWNKYSWKVNGDTILSKGEKTPEVNTSIKKENDNWFLEHKNTTRDYQAITRQTLSFIPNGTYKLTASVRCSAHAITDGARILIYDKDQTTLLKSRTIYYPQPNWIAISIDDIPVNNGEVTVVVYSNAKKDEFFQVDNLSFAIKP